MNNPPYNATLSADSAAYDEWLEAQRMLNNIGAPVMADPPTRPARLWERIQWAMRAASDLKAKIVLAEATNDLEVTFEDDAPKIEAPAAAPEKFKLTNDQEKAWKKIQAWVVLKAYKAPYFILRGYAGTGKTYLMQLLSQLELKNTVYFTAPTNKAANVLEDMLGVKTKTIHSLLGLRMSTDSEDQTLVFPDKMPELSFGCIIVIDEAGMCNTELCEFIEKARNHYGAKIMFVGDPAQLPPVGEVTSACWSATNEKSYRAFLKQVMRFDNQLLTLATYLRECVRTGERPVVSTDNDGDQGVFVLSEKDFIKKMLDGVKSPEHFIDTKVLAWRNKTVNKYNRLIRNQLGFGDTVYSNGDLLMVAAPIEIEGTVVATIDEDMTVKSVRANKIEVKGYDIPVHELVVQITGGPSLRLSVPTEEDEVLQILLSEMADKARRATKGMDRKIKWREFWQVKNKFHSVRYGYALTVHRSQGSTFKVGFVDKNDILSNSDVDTANRCAYVGFSRFSHSVNTF